MHVHQLRLTPEVPVACPRCRVPGAPGLRVEARPVPGPGGMACPRCGAVYPVIDGIPCLSADVPAFLAAQETFLAPGAPPADPSSGSRCCDDAFRLDPASSAFREVSLLGQHAAAHYPGSFAGLPLGPGLHANVATVERLASMLASQPLPSDASHPGILEVGCGPGRLAMRLSSLAPVAAFDLRIAPLRLGAHVSCGHRPLVPFRVEGRRFHPVEVSGPAPVGACSFVQGDVLSPPFAAESFAAVVAVSLLDTVPDPTFVLGQLDALLAPGGLLLLASPWQWEPGVTPPSEWWSAGPGLSSDHLLASLRGEDPRLPHLSYEVQRVEDGLPWTLPGHARLSYRYSLVAFLARKARRRSR